MFLARETKFCNFSSPSEFCPWKFQMFVNKMNMGSEKKYNKFLEQLRNL